MAENDWPQDKWRDRDALYDERESLRAALREAEAQRDEAKRELAEVRADHANEYRIWVKTMDNAVDVERRRAEALAELVKDLAIYRHATLGHKDYFHRGCTEKICVEARRALAGEPRTRPSRAERGLITSRKDAVAEPEREGAG